MSEKRLVSLYLDVDLFDYFTELARQSVEEDCEPINRQTIQRKRARLIIDIITEHYNTSQEER